MARIPFDLRTEPTNRGSAGAPTASASAGVGALGAQGLVGRAIGEGAQALGKAVTGIGTLIADHAERRAEHETRIDIAAGETQLRSIFQRARNNAALAENRHDAEQVYRDAYAAAEQWLKGESEDGIPHVRWPGAKRALDNFYTQAREVQEAHRIRRLEAFGRRADAARFEQGLEQTLHLATDTNNPFARQAALKSLDAVLETADHLVPEERQRIRETQRRAIDLTVARSELQWISNQDYGRPETISDDIDAFQATTLAADNLEFLTPGDRQDLTREAKDLGRALKARLKRAEQEQRLHRATAIESRVNAYLEGDASDPQPILAELHAAEADKVIAPAAGRALRKLVRAEPVERTSARVQAQLSWLELQLETGQVDPEDALRALGNLAGDATHRDAGRVLGVLRTAKSIEREGLSAEKRRRTKLLDAGRAEIERLRDLGLLRNRVLDEQGRDITEQTRRQEVAEALEDAGGSWWRGLSEEDRKAREDAALSQLQAKWEDADRLETNLVAFARAWVTAHPEGTEEELRAALRNAVTAEAQQAAFRVLLNRSRPGAAAGGLDTPGLDLDLGD